MLIAVLTLVVAAAPSSNLKVAAAGFKAIDVDDKRATFLSDYFADQLGAAGGFSVTTATEIGGILGLERQKELMGCNDASQSCAAELLGALGADAIITGSIARLGGSYAVTLKITAARDGAALASASGQIDRESELLPWLREQAEQMGPRVRKKLTGGNSAADVEVASSGGASSKAWIPAVAGGVLLIGAGVCYGIAAGTNAKITASDSPYNSPQDAEQAAESARPLRTVAFVAGGAGLVALGAAAVMGFMGGDKAQVTVSPFITESAGGLVVGGSY